MVRVVYDGMNGNLKLENEATGNQPLDTISTLTGVNIPMVDGGRSNGLMHDKIIIVDSQVLFIGSMNYSYNDTYRNDNNLLKITEPHLIANYQAKFNEMFEENLFGTKTWVQVPFPSFEENGVQVENYFSPTDHVLNKIVAYVQNATHSIHFMAYTYTSDDLSSAMIFRAEAGVEVQGVIESRNSSSGALVDLFCAGLEVKTDGNPYNMHHKVIILDGEIVITGSFNFTYSADTINDENILVIHSPAVAAVFEQEFARIFEEGKTPAASEIDCSN